MPEFVSMAEKRRHDWLIANREAAEKMPLSVTHPCYDPDCDTGDIVTHQTHGNPEWLDMLDEYIDIGGEG